MHHACTALRGIASDMGSRKSQIFPEKLDQERPVLHVRADAFPVHHQRYIGHVSSLGLTWVPCRTRAGLKRSLYPQRAAGKAFFAATTTMRLRLANAY